MNSREGFETRKLIYKQLFMDSRRSEVNSREGFETSVDKQVNLTIASRSEVNSREGFETCNFGFVEQIGR